jgi:transposase
VPYQGVWRPFIFAHDGQRVTDRVLVVWSDGKQRLDQQKRRTYLKRLLNGLDVVQKKLNSGRYKKRAYVEQRLLTLQRGNPASALVDVDLRGTDGTLALRFAINRSTLAAAQAMDGRYALATNGASLSADETLTLFKGQDRVEKRFRAVKGPLLVHPLFVRSEQRIEGLVFITLLALLVRAILERLCRQRQLSFTADRLFRRFAHLQAVDVTWSDGSSQRRAAQMSDFQAHVLDVLDWPRPETYAYRASDSADTHL